MKRAIMKLIERIILGYNHIDFMNIYIKSKKSKNKLVKKIYILKLKKITKKYNAFIPVESEIHESVTFPHELNGIHISSNAKIGENCVIFHQVTIGSNNLADSKGKGAPQIGDNVYIGAGAKIIGNVKIGNNVRIGANCVVVKDIEENTTVVGNGNRLIKSSTIKDNKFYKI